jgi:hypothetical protein
MQKPLKIVAFTRVKNELDIIEAFIRHHAGHIDKIIVLDDGSSDGTETVLQGLRREGLPLVLLREPSIGYDQSRSMTRLARMAINQFGADWIVPLDADEFVEPPEGVSLGELLAFKGSQVLRVGWSNFVWRPGDTQKAEINPVVRMVERLPARQVWTKVIVPAAAVANKDFEIGIGSHDVIIGGGKLDTLATNDICLCHYPIRSRDQFISKVTVSYLQLRAWEFHQRGLAFQYDAPYATLKAGMTGLEALMEDMSLHYAIEREHRIDVEPRRQPLRYAGGALTLTPAQGGFLPNLLDFAETVARRHGEQARQLSAIKESVASLTTDLTDGDILERLSKLRERSLAEREALAAAEAINLELVAGMNALRDRLAAAEHNLQQPLARLRRWLSRYARRAAAPAHDAVAKQK